jgi:hypothetical protein
MDAAALQCAVVRKWWRRDLHRDTTITACTSYQALVTILLAAIAVETDV